MTLPEQSNSDQIYPDGQQWRCECCYGIVADDQMACPDHADQPVMRVNRRIRFGPGQDDFRDVVVEYR